MYILFKYFAITGELHVGEGRNHDPVGFKITAEAIIQIIIHAAQCNLLIILNFVFSPGKIQQNIL